MNATVEHYAKQAQVRMQATKEAKAFLALPCYDEDWAKVYGPKEDPKTLENIVNASLCPF